MRLFGLFIYLFFLLLAACGNQGSIEKSLEQAKLHSQQGEFKSAIIEYRNAVKLEPENSDVRFLLAQAYLEVGSLQSAVKELRRALELGADKNRVMLPLGRTLYSLNLFTEIIDSISLDSSATKTDKASLNAILGEAYLGLTRNTEALDALEKARQIDDTNTDVRLAWARFERSKGNIDKLKKWLEPLLARNDPEAWSLMAEAEAIAKNYPLAIDAYTKSIKPRHYPHSDLMRRALVYLEMNDLENAQKDIDQLISAKSSWVGVKHVAGLIAFKGQEFDRAKELFQSVLSGNPDYAPSQYPLAIIEIRNNNLQSALSLLEQYTDKFPKNTRARLLQADVLIRLNETVKAQKLLHSLYETHKDDSRMLVLMGRSFLKQNNVAKAIENFKQSVAINPNDTVARFELAKALISQKSTLELGQKELRNLLVLNPRLMEAELTLFNSHLAQKQFRKSREIARNIQIKYPEKSLGDNLLALSFLKAGEAKKATKLLEKALVKFPKDRLLTKNLGKTYFLKNEFSLAKSLFKEVVAQEPGDIESLNYLARLARQEGDEEEAIKLLKQSVEKNPDDLNPRLFLAAEYVRLGEGRQAVELLSQDEGRYKNDPGYNLVMSGAKILVGEYQHAQRMLKTVLSNNPESIAAHLLLAKSYAKSNDSENLRKSLNQIVKSEPNRLDANIVLARLDLLEKNDEGFDKRVDLLQRNYPSNPDVIWLKAKKDSGDRNYEGAIGALSSLMDQNPGTGIVIELSRNLWRSGDRDSAISGLESWLDGNGNDVLALSDLAEYYALENRDVESRKIYERLVELVPGNPYVLNNLAWLMKDDNPQKGIEYARKALETNPDDPILLDTIAELYLKDNQPENALLYAQSAFQKLPGSEGIQLNYAKALLVNNDLSKAKRILSRLVEKPASKDIVRQARVELEKIK